MIVSDPCEGRVKPERKNDCVSYGESISVSFVRTSRRFEFQPVAVKVSSIATGSSFVQIILTYQVPGLRPSDQSQKKSKARNVNVATQQKFAVGIKSTDPSESKLEIFH